MIFSLIVRICTLFVDLVNVKCVDKPPNQITGSNRTDIPNNEMIGIYNNQTSSECEELCLQNVTNCRSTFHPENGSCYLYMINKADNSSPKNSQEERDSLSMMCCLLGLYNLKMFGKPDRSFLC